MCCYRTLICTSLFCGILFCISVSALHRLIIAFKKKGGGMGEYYEETSGDLVSLKCLRGAAQYAGDIMDDRPAPVDGGWFAFKAALDPYNSLAPGCTPAMTPCPSGCYDPEFTPDEDCPLS